MDEYMDIYDEHKNLTERIHLRGHPKATWNDTYVSDYAEACSELVVSTIKR